MTRAPYLYRGAGWPVGTRRSQRPTADSPALVAKKQAELAKKHAEQAAREEAARQQRIAAADAARAEKRKAAADERKQKLRETRELEKQTLTQRKSLRKRKGRCNDMDEGNGSIRIPKPPTKRVKPKSRRK